MVLQIKLEDLTGKIEKQDYTQHLQTVKYSDISRSQSKLKECAAQMIEEVQNALAKNTLIQTQLAITGQRAVTFALETNIINLPYANYKRIANFFETGKAYPIYVYFETISDYVNVSHFRIDLFAKQEEMTAEPEQMTERLVQAMQAKIKVVRTYKPVKKTKPKRTRRRTRGKTSKRK